jgi:hypothetical protein
MLANFSAKVRREDILKVIGTRAYIKLVIIMG